MHKPVIYYILLTSSNPVESLTVEHLKCLTNIGDAPWVVLHIKLIEGWVGWILLINSGGAAFPN